MYNRLHVDEPPQDEFEQNQYQTIYDVDVLWLYWWDESGKGWICKKDELEMV